MKPGNVEMIGFAEQVQSLSSSDGWKYIGKNPKLPDSTCPATSSPDIQLAWVEEQLRRAGVGEACLIALSCVGPLPWFELRLPKGHRGFAIYWTSLLVKGAMIVGNGVILLLHSQEEQLSSRVYMMDNLLSPSTPP